MTGSWDGASLPCTPPAQALVPLFLGYGTPIDYTAPSNCTDTPSVAYGYDARGRLTSRTRAGLPAETWSYSGGTEPAVGGGSTPAGLPLSHTDPAGRVTRYRYDSAGDLLSSTSPSGSRVDLTVDALGRPTASTSTTTSYPNGLTTSYALDALGRVTTVTKPGVTDVITGKVHTASTAFARDADDNPLTVTTSDLTGGDAARTTSYTYDALGHVLSAKDPAGGTRTSTYNPDGDPATVVDELGRAYAYGYDSRDNATSTTLKGFTGDPAAPVAANDVVLTASTYDPAGLLVTTTDPLGRSTGYTYARSQVTTVSAVNAHLTDGTTATRQLAAYTYDGAGRLATSSQAAGLTSTVYAYDPAGRLVTTTSSGGTSGKPGYQPNYRTDTWAYDAADEVTLAQHTDGTRTEAETYSYDALGDTLTAGRLTGGLPGSSSSPPTWATTASSYDQRGFRTASTDPRGTSGTTPDPAYTTNYGSDAAGRTVAVTSPPVADSDSGATPVNTLSTALTSYDTYGDQVAQRDGRGNTTTTSYDALGRPTSTTLPAYTPPGTAAPVAATSRNTYDAAGRVTASTDPLNRTTTNAYDGLDRLTRTVAPPLSAGATGATTAYGYDTAGNRTSTGSGGSTVTGPGSASTGPNGAPDLSAAPSCAGNATCSVANGGGIPRCTGITAVSDACLVTSPQAAGSGAGGTGDGGAPGAPACDSPAGDQDTPSSRKLRQNLGADNAQPGDHAHHIVAGAAPRAGLARDVLRDAGIGINDAGNGVFLPGAFTSTSTRMTTIPQ